MLKCSKNIYENNNNSNNSNRGLWQRQLILDYFYYLKVCSVIENGQYGEDSCEESHTEGQ